MLINCINRNGLRFKAISFGNQTKLLYSAQKKVDGKVMEPSWRRSVASGRGGSGGGGRGRGGSARPRETVTPAGCVHAIGAQV